MSTWGEMLLFNSKEKQILDLEKRKMKNKMRKNSVRTAVKQTNKQASKQTNKYNNFEYACLNFFFYLQEWCPSWNTIVLERHCIHTVYQS